jgi:hypothetical protein
MPGGGGNPITTVFNSTVQQCFGNGAWRFSGDNHGMSIPYNSALDDFNDDDFVIEMRIKFVLSNMQQAIFSRYSNDIQNYMSLIIDSTNHLVFNYRVNNAYYISNKATIDPIPTDQFYHHIALVRSGNAFYIYVDGISQALNDNALTATLPPLPYPTLIGLDYNKSNPSLNGYVDEFLITIGTDKGWNTSIIEVPMGQYYIQ